MPLPASPPISLAQILSIFGAPANTPLTSMVRGGAYVPNAAPNLGVPTAPPIGLLHFLGAGPAGVAAATSNVTVSAISLTPTDALTTYTINTSGVVQQAVNGGAATTVETWLISGTSADFQCRATIISGTFTSGTAGTWLNCNTSPVWTRNRTSNVAGVDQVVFTLELRRVSDSVVVDSSTITLYAEVYV